ncbi:hypothetical protein ACIQUU_35750, partial [Streptomyces sp. NPDC101116]|uniref:hypothetical protein n=1 Tax=Streptomyces sp. NPDC101116 TaxID=3366107 RepID=UPI0037FB5CAA
MGLQRETAGQQDGSRRGKRDRRAEQRVRDRRQAGRGKAAGGGSLLQPVVLVLEGVGGQVDAAGVVACEDAVPVEFGA